MKILRARCPARIAVLLCLLGLPTAFGRAAEPPAAEVPTELSATGLPGGLCVQLGTADTTLAVAAARSGRFVVQVLDTDPTRIAETRTQLDATGLYGLISVDCLGADGRLPYAENLVNAVVVTEPVPPKMLADIVRVLCPRGVLMMRENLIASAALAEAGLQLATTTPGADTGWQWAVKPWPNEMDEWTHPRHSSSGNAVSQDTLVGPPRRVRWLAGAWEEVGNLVTGDGCNYYGGILARDGFNGLRLWQTSLNPSPAKGGFGYRPRPGSAAPVVGGGCVFVVSDGELRALDSRTGAPRRTYAESASAREVLYDQGVLIAVQARSVHGYDAESGQSLWKHDYSDPRCVVAGDGRVALIHGDARRGEQPQVEVLDGRSGTSLWTRNDYAWIADADRCVYHQGRLAFEISSLNDDGPGNALKLVDIADGREVYQLEFLPGMNHMRQARAMFIGDRMWLLTGGRDEDKQRQPTEVSSIYIPTGKVEATYPAGLAHCFPPVATVRYMFSGEMDLTDLTTGRVDANRITKAACGRDVGWVPAHGLINVTPKHCVCWPMLRGYTALAPARPGGNVADQHLSEIEFPVQAGAAVELSEPSDPARDWPCYRHDAWRSGSTVATGPAALDTIWSVKVDGGPAATGPILADWAEDPFIKGPVTPPVIAGDTVVVARPNAHQVVALDATTGTPRWQFTASGRVDTPPTLYRGLCLFGSKNGWVYCLRLGDGALVWQRRAAPHDERIVAYGQVESPWPVPGSVLIVDDHAYFAAGRQSFADGGVFVFSIDPLSGQARWVQRLNTIPQSGYYTSSGLEFDNFDLLFQEGDAVAMSRWVFDRATGKMSVDLWKAFARLNTGHGSAMVPQGCWSYPPRNQSRTKTFAPRRPLVVFRDNRLVGCLESKQSLYRRDFDLEGGEQFETKWITGWAASDGSRKDGLAWRSQRLAEKASWTTEVYPPANTDPTIDALVLTADRTYAAGSDGTLTVVANDDGRVLHRQRGPAPVWDGMAVARGRLYLTTQDGQLLCLGSDGATQ